MTLARRAVMKARPAPAPPPPAGENSGGGGGNPFRQEGTGNATADLLGGAVGDTDSVYANNVPSEQTGGEGCQDEEGETPAAAATAASPA